MSSDGMKTGIVHCDECDKDTKWVLTEELPRNRMNSTFFKVGKIYRPKVDESIVNTGERTNWCYCRHCDAILDIAPDELT